MKDRTKLAESKGFCVTILLTHGIEIVPNAGIEVLDGWTRIATHRVHTDIKMRMPQAASAFASSAATITSV
jgi:hypothetical protein